MVATHHASARDGIQVRAHFLHRFEASTSEDAFFGGGRMPEIKDDGGGAGSARRRGRWRESDLRRVMAAARRAGIEHYRVEVAPDGTITIEVGLEDHKSGRRRRP